MTRNTLPSLKDENLARDDLGTFLLCKTLNISAIYTLWMIYENLRHLYDVRGEGQSAELTRSDLAKGLDWTPCYQLSQAIDNDPAQ